MLSQLPSSYSPSPMSRKRTFESPKTLKTEMIFAAPSLPPPRWYGPANPDLRLRPRKYTARNVFGRACNQPLRNQTLGDLPPRNLNFDRDYGVNEDLSIEPGRPFKADTPLRSKRQYVNLDLDSSDSRISSPSKRQRIKRERPVSPEWMDLRSMRMELRSEDMDLGFKGNAEDRDDDNLGRRKTVLGTKIGFAKLKESRLFNMRTRSVGTLDLSIRGRNGAGSHILGLARKGRQSKR